MTLRVLELYCGIGGMHEALKMTGVSFQVVAAMDINTTVLKVYKYNFPRDHCSNRNILSLSPEELNSMNIDLITMSPPCQPFCRTGLQLDVNDERTSSLSRLLQILPRVQFKYMLVENVKGFEESEARVGLLKCLGSCNFHWQEFLLTPLTLGIPNSRLRYYLIGKRKDLTWSFLVTSTILSEVPLWNSQEAGPRPFDQVRNIQKTEWRLLRKKHSKISDKLESLEAETDDERPNCVSDVLEFLGPSATYDVPVAVINKYGQAMDIVNPQSQQTCCFTKSYGQFVKGTGSVLAQKISEVLNDGDEGLKDLELRYFTPREILRLMCYSEKFDFPLDLTLKQKYRSLGNSVNVFVISVLMSLLLSGS